jgi:Domain of unknown function (DUF4157)
MDHRAEANMKRDVSDPFTVQGMLQRKCACGQHTIAGGECSICQNKQPSLQRAIRSAETETESSTATPPIVSDALRSPGQPLGADTRAFFEPRFGHDFSRVRVHTDEQAANSARSVNALAYTLGRDVVFGTGQYSPGTTTGAELLAHELTHVVQQSNAGQRIQKKDAPASRGGSTTKAAPAKDSPATKDAPATKKAKVKKITVTKKGSGFDDFQGKRGGGKDLGYHKGWDAGSLYMNFRFQVTAEVDGDMNKCTYAQTLSKEATYSGSTNKTSGDDTYAELKANPLVTAEWMKVDGNNVVWIDAPGLTSDAGLKTPDLPFDFKVNFKQSAKGQDGEEVKVSWQGHYGLDAQEKWTKQEDGLDVSASHK